MKLNKLNKKLFPIVLAGFLLVQPFSALILVNTVNAETCADECAYIGQTETSGDSYRVCGDYDSDCCYEWSPWYTNPPTCADECAYVGQHECSGMSGRTCGDYDSDCCYEWSSWQSCDSQCYYCGDGTCNSSCGETSSNCSSDCGSTYNDPITGSLHVSSYSVCRGESIAVTLTGQDDDGVIQLKLMIDDGVDSYTFDCFGAEDCSHTWNITKSTAGTYKLTAKFFGQKPDGITEVYSIDDIYIEFRACPINVDIKANGLDGPITIPYNSSANLTWTSENANSCTASGAWSGIKSTSGSELTGSLTSSKTYNIACTGSEGSASDSVTINISENNPPIAEAGPDKEIYETESVILEGSGSDPDGDAINYHWSCTGGTLSNPNIAQPVFYSPIVSSNTTYTCTLTVTDSHGASDSDSTNILVKEHHCLTLSVSLSANPNSDCSPLNDVDLTASVSGTASGEIIYFFDCTNNGIWERTITSGDSVYTASDLCDYSSAGNYTAKVRVQREGLSAENTTQINVQSCYNAPSVDIKANGSDSLIIIPYNSSANLTWTSQNVDSCTASNAWSGSKSTSGSQSTGNLTSSKTYNITCSGPGGSASDSIIVDVGAYSSNPPVADAGSDKSVYENESVTLNGSGYDPDGYSVDYYWYCSGGSLSNRYVARPSFNAPSVSSNRYYTCDLTVTDNEGLTDSDSMRVSVRERDDSDISLNVSKSVKNLSRGDTQWYHSYRSADPSDNLLFQIKIESTGSTEARDVMVKDSLPDNIIYEGNLRIDNVYSSKNISTQAINIGDLSPGQTKTITFEAKVESKGEFSYGTTNLINTALAYNTETSDTDTCKVIVRRTAVAGATDIATGIGNGILNSILFPLIITFIILWVFKSKFVGFDKWSEKRKKEIEAYRANRLLKRKIAQLKTQGIV